MKSPYTLLLSATLASLLCAVPALAQPDPNNGAKAENPPNRPVGGNAAAMVDRMRQLVARYGVTDPTQQEVLVNFVLSETRERGKVQLAGQKLMASLRNEGGDDALITGLLNEYMATVEEDKDRRTKALQELKKKVDYTRLPKVESYLVLSGILGDGPAIMGGMDMGGRGGRGGMGGWAGGNAAGGFGANGGGPARGGDGAGGRGGGAGGGGAQRPDDLPAAGRPQNNANPFGRPPARDGGNERRNGAANGPTGFGNKPKAQDAPAPVGF